MEQVQARIRMAFSKFNQTSGNHWQLQISMGSAIYRQDSQQPAGHFLHHVDQLMYLEKASRQRT